MWKWKLKNLSNGFRKFSVATSPTSGQRPRACRACGKKLIIPSKAAPPRGIRCGVRSSRPQQRPHIWRFGKFAAAWHFNACCARGRAHSGLWTAAGSAAPRRFRTHENFGSVKNLPPARKRRGAALCHRTPRRCALIAQSGEFPAGRARARVLKFFRDHAKHLWPALAHVPRLRQEI